MKREIFVLAEAYLLQLQKYEPSAVGGKDDVGQSQDASSQVCFDFLDNPNFISFVFLGISNFWYCCFGRSCVGCTENRSFDSDGWRSKRTYRDTTGCQSTNYSDAARGSNRSFGYADENGSRWNYADYESDHYSKTGSTSGGWSESASVDLDSNSARNRLGTGKCCIKIWSSVAIIRFIPFRQREVLRRKAVPY